MKAVTNINVNNIKKVVNISVAGRVSMEEAQAFINDYQVKINAINASQYTLEVDCSDMQVLTPDMTDNLTSVMQMYKASGFKKVIYQVKSNVLLKMQLSRLIRNSKVAEDGQDVSVIDIG